LTFQGGRCPRGGCRRPHSRRALWRVRDAPNTHTTRDRRGPAWPTWAQALPPGPTHEPARPPL